LSQLPVHGFVLAGGRSLRMGQDKAMLIFDGRPLIEQAVDRLRGLCAAVAIAGNREDLAGYAPIVLETRLQQGPAAGVEAALLHSSMDWVVCTPVDAPLAPAALLRAWLEALEPRFSRGVVASYLRVGGTDQPAFCALDRRVLANFTAALDRGDRRLLRLLRAVAEQQEIAEHLAPGSALFVCDVESLLQAEALPSAQVWFANLNTPEEFAAAQQSLQETLQARLRAGGEHRTEGEAKP
jgi:molybdopterin-guanine dinucleotide biosynthesis protein A